MKADSTLVNVQGQEECYSFSSSSVGITMERPSFQFFCRLPIHLLVTAIFFQISLVLLIRVPLVLSS